MSEVQDAISHRPILARATPLPPREARSVHIVVGQRIKAQCDDPRLLSVAEAIALIDAWPPAGIPLALALGQGCDDESLDTLYRAVGRCASRVRIEPPSKPRRASATATHKHVGSNIAITQPVANGDGSYGCALLLDERSADVSDHLTGRHVPGQMIAEAVRQTAIAVTECFVLPAARALESRFVTHEFSVTYADFTLPLPIDIRCVPLKLRRAGGSNMRVTYEIHFLQLAHTTAVARFCLSVVDRRFFDAREAVLLDTLYERLAARHAPHPSLSPFSRQPERSEQ